MDLLIHLEDVISVYNSSTEASEARHLLKGFIL